MKKKKDTHILNNTLNIASFWKRYGYLHDASRPQFNLQKKLEALDSKSLLQQTKIKINLSLFLEKN